MRRAMNESKSSKSSKSRDGRTWNSGNMICGGLRADLKHYVFGRRLRASKANDRGLVCSQFPSAYVMLEIGLQSSANHSTVFPSSSFWLLLPMIQLVGFVPINPSRPLIVKAMLEVCVGRQHTTVMLMP